MPLKDHLVQGAQATARRYEEAGSHTHYLSYDPLAEEEPLGANPPTQFVRIRLPKGATDVSLHGPGDFKKRGKGTIYGVRITFTQKTDEGRSATHSRTIELPHPAVNVQLLDREPDEAYLRVA